MKFLVFSAFFAFVAVTVQSVKPNPSFMKFIGNYKVEGVSSESSALTVKNYYVSQRISYNWIDAFIFCKSIGMQMAVVNTPEEMRNLAELANGHLKSFKDPIFIDGRQLGKSEDSKCLSITKRTKGRFEIKRVDCQTKRQKFMCEDLELTEKYVKVKASDKYRFVEDAIDVKASFFSYLGKFRSYSGPSKSYYLSDFPKPIFDAIKTCQSFDMILASPKSQDEYDSIQSYLKVSDKFTDDASIAGYRSEKDKISWVDTDNKLLYAIDWMSGEPNNARGRENCISFRRRSYGSPEMNDYDCDDEKNFVCEYQHKDTFGVQTVKTPKEELLRFMTPLATYDTGSSEKALYLSTYELDWINANLMCRHFGMELLTPETEDDNEALISKFGTLKDLPKTLPIGFTQKGTESKWYNAHDGNVLYFDIGWYELAEKKDNCMIIHNYYGNWSYADAKCFDIDNRFVCQTFDHSDFVLDYNDEEDHIGANVVADS